MDIVATRVSHRGGRAYQVRVGRPEPWRHDFGCAFELMDGTGARGWRGPRYRCYGIGPATVAVPHGGPGALGSMAPVARRLALSGFGVIEPMRTADSVAGCVAEQHVILAEASICASSMTLVGHSWGAVLAWLYAAAYPDHVARLILVGCPPLAASYALAIDATRRSRMSDAKSAEYDRAVAVLADASAPDKTDAARRLGVLLAGVDDFAPLPVDARAFDSVDTTGLAFGAIWPEVARMREDGDLLALAPHIRCPVVAIHGDHDPHPADGVEVPLIGTVPDVRFHLLARCGHTPWRERYASEAFYRVLRTELAHLKKGERL